MNTNINIDFSAPGHLVVNHCSSLLILILNSILKNTFYSRNYSDYLQLLSLR